MRTRHWAGVTVGLVVVLRASEALACGGCFGPPPPTPRDVQVVTDHRMVLSLSTTQTTLWDQFAYSGRPSEFSWILPIRYTPGLRVAIADDGFLSYVNAVTAPQLIQPRFPWAPCPFAPGAGGFADASAAADSGSRTDSGVVVLRMETVGPYSVSIIRGTDPMAIRDWLRENGYSVPSELGPVIDFYTALSMDYVALRLRPAGEGMTPRMQPVRVTMEGYVPSLPLRMIAAGVADKVGLSLVVFANSRIEAGNFPNGELADSNFTWDWSRGQNPVTDYLNAFTALNDSNGRRLWLTEVAGRQDLNAWNVPGAGFRPPPADGGGASEDGGISTTPTDPTEDLRIIRSTVGSNPYVTRLRADLPAIMLDRDLTLQSSDRGERAQLYQYGNQTNIPPRPSCLGPGDGGFVGAVDAGVTSGGLDGGLDSGTTTTTPMAATSMGGLSCAVDVAGGAKGGWAAWALGALAAVALRRRRR